MVKVTIEVPGEWLVSKGPRDKAWEASAVCDVSKLSPEIVGKLAMHGLQQKIADAAAGAKTADEADAAMNKAIDSLVAGAWSSRGTGEGIDEETRVSRSVVRSAVKAKFGSKSPEWAKFTGLSDADQNAKLDEWFAANADAFKPAVEQELERRKAAAKAKGKLASSLAISI